MNEKFKSKTEVVTKDTNQTKLMLLNAWLDLIEMKKGKPISEIVKDCMSRGSEKKPEDQRLI